MTHSKVTKARLRRGLTLVEVVTVLVLLGVLAGFAVSQTPSSNSNVVVEADRLKSHLRYVQIRAQADSYEWRFVFTNATTYELGPVVLPGHGFTPSTIPGANETEGTLTDGVTTNSGTAIRFDSWGRPLTDFGALLTTDKTITLTSGGASQSIIIRAETGLIE